MSTFSDVILAAAVIISLSIIVASAIIARGLYDIMDAIAAAPAPSEKP
jgi:hypothetical protein